MGHHICYVVYILFDAVYAFLTEKRRRIAAGAI